MKKFIYYLRDNPEYPNIICANNRDEAIQMLMENLADRYSILKIIEEQSDSQKNPERVQPVQPVPQVVQQAPEVVKQPEPVPQVISAARFFTDNGVEYKLEDGKLYKKAWTDVSPEARQSYRLLDSKTQKPVNKQLILQILDWVELSA